MMTETEVILKFMFDARQFINENLETNSIRVEVPCGSWTGAKNRSIGDIDLGVISPIEAKGTFSDSKKDYEDVKKNLQVKNYLYASSVDMLQKEFNYWNLKDLDNVIVYLPDREEYRLLKYKKEELETICKLLGGKIEIFGE